MSDSSPTGGDTTSSLPASPIEPKPSSNIAANPELSNTVNDSPAPTNNDPTPTLEETTVTQQPDPTTVTATQVRTTTTQQLEPPQQTTTTAPTQTSAPQTTQSTTTEPSNNDLTTNAPATTPSADSSTTIVVQNPDQTSTVIITQTTTTGNSATISSTLPLSSTSVPTSGSGSSASGLNTGGKIAVAVVVPIASVTLLFILGLFFWRKRRARKVAEEQRKEDLKNYAFNPNNPTLPPIGGAAGGDVYEMKEDTSVGYRGWGTSTLASSVGRKASTTMSGGGPSGQPYSDITNIIQAHYSDFCPGEPIRSDDNASPEGEILGAMGPPTSYNRGGDIHRGPSNASSHYSMGAGSEDSEGRGIGIAYGGPYHPQQQQRHPQPQPSSGYDQYSTANPYAENPYAFAPAPPGARNPVGQNSVDLGGQPVIRDNPSRRTTQIQNAPPYVPQPGISQNF